jgi:hypothetical protein
VSQADRLIDRALRRAPDFVIGGAERPYLRRWWLLPRNPVLNVYLHQFLRSDDDRALHSHPWLFNVSWLLRGGYVEHTPGGMHKRMAGAVKFRWGSAWHRVQLLRAAIASGYTGTPRPFGPELPCWTLFITGPRVRSWGFDCDGRFVHWRDFTAPSDKGSIGKGCEG